MIFVGDAPVIERRDAGPYAVLTFQAPAIARESSPGQFVNIAPGAGGCILRRPFSIYDVHGDRVQVAFDAVGAGTAWLAARAPGERISVVGPLGRGFTPPKADAHVLLVGGGYGAAPIIYFARTLKGTRVRTTTILGAATAKRVFDPTRAADLSDEIIITTDDGSAGVHGVVTDAMAGIKADAIYACGPMPMLAAVSRASGGTPCEVAVEEFMACGIGVCWTCVIPVSNGERRHLRACTEGPVFDGEAVAWA